MNAARIDRWLRALERGSMLLSAFGLLAIMAIVVADVVLRYLFSAPIGWSYDVVSMYLVTLVIYMALANTFQRGAHIKVDLVARLRGTRMLAGCEIVGYLASLLLFGLILFQMVIQGWTAWVNTEVVDGAIPWPTWPPYLIGAVGIALMSARMALSIVLRMIAFHGGQPISPETEEAHPGGHPQ